MSTDAVGCDQKFSNNQQKKISFKHGFQNFPGGPVDFPGGSVVKNLPAVQETQIQSLGQEDPLEK